MSKLKWWDAIFTNKLNDPVSRFIAWATHGPWSHVALYMGDGTVSELVATGVRNVPLTVYKGRNYRIGAYRKISLMNLESPMVPPFTVLRSRFRDGHNYKGPVLHGIRSFGNDHGHELIPNSQVYCGSWVLIDHL